MFPRLTALTLLVFLAPGAQAMGLPTFADILPIIKLPSPQDQMSTRGTTADK